MYTDEEIEYLVEICFNLLIENENLDAWYTNHKVKRQKYPKEVQGLVSNKLLDKVANKLKVKAKYRK